MTWIQLAYLFLAAVIAFASQWTTGAVQHAMLAIPAFMLGHMTPWKGGPSKRPSLPPVALVFAVLLAGCGASLYDERRTTINATAERVTALQPAVLALCDADPGPRCDDARKAYEVAEASVAAAHDANEISRVTDSGLPEMYVALAKLADSAREVANAVR